MSVVIDSATRVLVQGITGKESRFWTGHMIDYGTNVVAGVTPGKEGQKVEGVPVFHSVRRAVEEFPADASLLFVPPRFARDASSASHTASRAKRLPALRAAAFRP